eukprot:471524_1
MSTAATDLRSVIDTVLLLNVNKKESTISADELAFQESVNYQSYVISDADEELLVLIKFNNLVNLRSIQLFALPPKNDEFDANEISPPNQVHLYKISNLSINFDDVQSLTPNKSVKCSAKKLAKGQNIKLQNNSKNAIHFSQIQFLAIYIQSNQNDTDATYLNGIKFKLKVDDKNQQSNNLVTEVTEQKRNDIKYEFDATYTQNMQKLNELVKAYAAENLSDSTNDYSTINSYLAPESSVRQRINESQCNGPLEKCQALKRIANVLEQYHLYVHYNSSQDDEKQMAVDVNLDNIENVTGILNDFNHLLCKHASANEFEQIYNVLIDNKQICD